MYHRQRHWKEGDAYGARPGARNQLEVNLRAEGLADRLRNSLGNSLTAALLLGAAYGKHRMTATENTIARPADMLASSDSTILQRGVRTVARTRGCATRCVPSAMASRG
jgi:hypothetical protein